MFPVHTFLFRILTENCHYVPICSSEPSFWDSLRNANQTYSPDEMWCHTVTQGRGSEGELINGVGSQYPSHNLGTWFYPALLPLKRTTRLPVVDWTDAPSRFKWTRPFRRKTKCGFCACAITFQTQSTSLSNFRHISSASAVAVLSRDCRWHLCHCRNMRTVIS